jgi:hypothetical protein
MIDLDPDENKPELDEYYVKGVKLGETPAKPAGGFGGGQGGFGGGQESDMGTESDATDGADTGDQKRKAAASDARSVVVEMLRDYEAKVKAALVDSDPIDSEQPPVRQPRRGRGAGKPRQIAGPARDDKPNIS